MLKEEEKPKPEAISRIHAMQHIALSMNNLSDAMGDLAGAFTIISRKDIRGDIAMQHLTAKLGHSAVATEAAATRLREVIARLNVTEFLYKF
jgi:hypothetical protein